MRSPRGALGAILLLLAVPLAALSQLIFPDHGSAVIHFLFAAGVFLVSSSVFDFRLPAWIQWTALCSSAALAALFLIQGASELANHPGFTHFAYRVLGQTVERWLVSLFLMWCLAVLLGDSRGKTRLPGFVAVAVVFCVDLYGHVLAYAGSSLNLAAPSLKALYLLLPAWLLLESRKPGRSGDSTPVPAR